MVEVLAALVILVAAVIPVAGVLAGGARRVAAAGDVTRASFLVRQAAEEVIDAARRDFSSLDELDPLEPDYLNSGLELRRAAGPAPEVDGGAGKVKKVTVGVYRDGRLLADAVFLVYEDGH